MLGVAGPYGSSDAADGAGVRAEQGQDRERADVPLPQAAGTAAAGILGVQHPLHMLNCGRKAWHQPRTNTDGPCLHPALAAPKAAAALRHLVTDLRRN